MNIVKFQISDLEDMMAFLDDNLTENYEKRVFHNIHQRWPEGFLLVKDEKKIVENLKKKIGHQIIGGINIKEIH